MSTHTSKSQSKTQWYPFDPADANLEFRFKFNYTGAASRSAAPPAKPTWPSTFFAQFQEFHAGGNGQGSEGRQLPKNWVLFRGV